MLLPVQAAVGEYQYRNGLPWGVVLVHVAVAGLVWMSVVTLAVRARGAIENVGSVRRGCTASDAAGGRGSRSPRSSVPKTP